MKKPKMPASETHYRAGNAHWFEGNPKQALRAYEKAIAALDADAAPAHVIDVKGAYALCLCELGHFDAAFEIYPALHRFCVEQVMDETVVLRQWAKALEQTGDFRRAREKYESIVPMPDTAPLDILKWNHALGLLNWRDGRLSEAHKNLRAATHFMPTDPAEAASVLSVLGNDALLSLELGDQPRAMRLADRMSEIQGKADSITLSSEINIIHVRAALAKRQGNLGQQVAILRAGVELIEEKAPDDWMRRLDLASDYVAALIEHIPSANAISYLSALCATAPDDVAWIGRFMLARLQGATGDFDAAQENLIIAMASFVGSGSAESEAELVLELAGLCLHNGNAPAAIFLGKLMLQYLTQIAHAAERAELRQILAAGDQIIQQTVDILQRSGRFEEALAIGRVLERVERYVLVLRDPDRAGLTPSPVPFDAKERAAENAWLQQRDILLNKRLSGDLNGAKSVARDMVQALMAFDNTPRFDRLAPEVGPPRGQNLRLSLAPSGDHTVIHYAWADRSRSERIDLGTSGLIALAADLINTLPDNKVWQSPAQELYRLLIAPIQSELSDIDCLEIVAFGLLGRIPIGLLFDGEQCVSQQVRLRYLVNVDAPKPDGVARSGLLHFAGFQSGPLSARHGLSELPAQVRSVTGAAFTRDGLLDGLQSRPAYLSIATHLDTEPTHPDHWTLWLGSDEPLYLSDFGSSAFDLNGVRIAVLATCSSGLEDEADVNQSSLAALALEKGVHSFIGTLWEISETAAARFVDAFWRAYFEQQQQDPAAVLAKLQAEYAAAATRPQSAPTATGGIGERGGTIAPSDWAAFAVFESSNLAQHPHHDIA